MTKKHFIALAAAMRQVAGLPDTDTETHAICCRAIATVARKDNPRFDYDKFLKACIPGLDGRKQVAKGQWRAHQ